MTDPAAAGDGSRPRPPAGRALSWWFLAFGLLAGLGFVYLVPPGQQLDEPNHFLRVWTLGHGVALAPIGPDGRAGTEVPDCVRAFPLAGFRRGLQRGPIDRKNLWRDPEGCLAHDGLTTIEYSNTAVNSPATYPEREAIVAALTAAGLGVPMQFLAARLAGLAAYLALVFLALRVTTRCRTLLFVIACLPVSVTMAAAVSSDSFPIALSLLAVALTIRLRDDPEARGRLVVGLGVTLAVLAVAKNTYSPFMLLIFLVPAERFGSPGVGRWVRRLAAPVIGWAATVAWAVQVQKVRHILPPTGLGEGVDLTHQTTWVVHHPWGFLLAALHGTFSWSTAQHVVPGAVHVIGANHEGHTSTLVGALAPGWMVGLFAAVLVLAVVGSTRGRAAASAPQAPVPPRRRWGALALVAAVWVLVFLLVELGVYASVNKVGAGQVAFVQGRYFVELFPLVALAIAVWRPPGAPEPRWASVVARVGSGALLAGALFVTNAFYFT